MLKVYPLDPSWTLPSRLDDNPLVWMLQVNGFMMDVRHAPREVQEIAFNKGLIPYIPADRQNQGLVMDFSVADNSILEVHYQPPFTRGLSLQKKVITKFASDLVREFDVRTPNVNVPVKNLSGGNKQKVIIGREFSKKMDLLVVMQPTWGLDVGAIEYVHQKILEARENGVTILLISTDLEEVRKLSDRILVIYEGEIVGQADSQTSLEEIGLMMSGSNKKAVRL